MKAVVVSQRESLPKLEAGWSRMADDLPFCHPGWMLSWWDVYGRNESRELFVVSVLDDAGKLVGLAPWYRERGSFGNVIKFLGSGKVCSDYLTVLAVPGNEKAVSQQLAAWLAETSTKSLWTELRFDCSPESPETPLTLLLDELRNKNIRILESPTVSCWRIQLPEDMDEYLKRLSRNQRSQIRRGYRKQVDSGNVTIEIATTSDQLERQWPVLVDLHQRRRTQLGEVGCFADDDFAKFLKQATIKLGESGKAAIFVLKEHGQPLAAEHQLLGSETVFAYQSGIDPERMELSPGKLANYTTIKTAIDSGKSQFDFCRGDEQYKSHWRAEPVACHEIRVFANSISADVSRQIWATSERVKACLRGTTVG